jgi:mannose-1-phosphate guanylyltransferase
MEKEIKDHLYVLILCGGGGTRLWPRSRQKTPKQFLANLFGQQTLFTQTVQRAQLLTTNEKIFVVTTGDYVDEVISQGKVISPRNIIAEPQGKNTAMAMGVGVAYIKTKDPKAIILNFASDHQIDDKEIFIKTMRQAAQAACLGDYLVTVGIKPTSPHTGLGYIEAGKEIGKEKGVYKVVSFKEKPDLETAKRFIKSGKYFWNANLYTWSVQSAWRAYRRYAPSIFKLLAMIEKNIGTKNEELVLKKAYEKAENISVDYALSEKADNLLLVPGIFFWSDVGDWKVIYDLSQKDNNGNVVIKFGKNGEFTGIDAKNNLVQFNNQLIAAIGVEDLIIIQTTEAILVCKKDKAEDVKKFVEDLKKKNKIEYL